MPSDRTSITASATIHRTAIVHPAAQLGRGVEVGPYAVIAADVVIGDGTVIGPHVVIEDGVVIGRGNQVGAGTVIGGPPQHKGYAGERSFVRMGDRNVLRENVTINRAYGEGETTEIGSDNYLMSSAHVGHNCRIGNDVVLVSGAELGGYVTVDDQANISGHAGAHQFVRIGRLAMVGGLSAVRQDVPPFVLVAGVPARAYGLNAVGLGRAGVPSVHRAALKRAFALLYRSRLSVKTAVVRMEAELGDDPYVQTMIQFIRAGSHGRGIVRWAREGSL